MRLSASRRVLTAFIRKGTVTVLGGSLTAQCGDDAVHADGKADIAGGTVTPNAAESIEATYVLIRSGDISIKAPMTASRRIQVGRLYPHR